MEKTDVVEINGRRYDAHTGALLGAPVRSAQSESTSKPVHISVSKHDAQHKGRQPAKHLRPHAAAASKLLMRQAVKKPAVHRKTAIRAQSALEPVQPLSDLAPIRRSERRLTHAKQIHKSQRVNHFVPLPIQKYTETPSQVSADTHHVAVRRVAADHHAARRPQTSAELLEVALQSANSHEEQPLPKRHLKKRSRLFTRLHAA